MGDDRAHTTDRSWGLAALAVAAALLTGCTTAADLRANPSGAPARSSTAEHDLENLKSDLFFVHLPPGSTRTAGTCTPTPDDPHGGGRCTIDFTSASPPQAVYDYFARSADLTGWTTEQKDAEGRAVVWSTTYRSGSHPRVILTPVSPQQASPPYSYELAGSI